MGKRGKATNSIQSDALASALTPLAAALIRTEQSVGALVHAAKIGFLHAAIAEMQSTKGRPSVSRLSVITGMTRKEVSSLLKAEAGFNSKKRPPKQMDHRALRVLRGWKTDPLYTDGGQPRELQIRGNHRSFATLVRAYGGDVPTVAVLRELERMNAVRHTKSGGLRVRSRLPHANAALSGRFDEFSRLVSDFSGTVAQLLAHDKPQVYFGFKEVPATEERQIARFKESFGRRAATLLEGVEHWSATSSRLASNKRGARRIGLGVYLVDCNDPKKVISTRKS